MSEKNNFNQINKFPYDSYKHENNAKESWFQTMLKFDPIKITFSARQQLSIFYAFSLAHTLCQFWLTEVIKYADLHMFGRSESSSGRSFKSERPLWRRSKRFNKLSYSFLTYLEPEWTFNKKNVLTFNWRFLVSFRIL